MPRWKYVLFDLDGTLVNSGPVITKRFAQTFSFFGQEVPDEETLLTFLGPSAMSTMHKYFGPGLAADALQHFRGLSLEEGMNGLELYAGIGELIQNLSDSGLKLAVATSKPENDAVQIIEYFGLQMCFGAVAGSKYDAVTHQKEEIIREAARRLNSEPNSQMVMIGDRKFDVEGARAAGMDSIFARWGGADLSEASGATEVAERPELLSKLLFS